VTPAPHQYARPDTRKETEGGSGGKHEFSEWLNGVLSTKFSLCWAASLFSLMTLATGQRSPQNILCTIRVPTKLSLSRRPSNRLRRWVNTQEAQDNIIVDILTNVFPKACAPVDTFAYLVMTIFFPSSRGRYLSGARKYGGRVNSQRRSGHLSSIRLAVGFGFGVLA